MALLKCKMCGGDLEISPKVKIAECEYCGSKQTVPTADNEKKMTLFSRANRLRFACEFDKAYSVYESIVADFPEEAEAYWGLVLCDYGIEYVDDPTTGKKIPTCHRSSFDSIFENENLNLVIEYSDKETRAIYRNEAKQIEELRKGIVDVSSKEKPYDIFICYKETDANGVRTTDSVIAQDVYDALTEKGYNVFFSRITLEDKLGVEYEPYIFAALNSAKIMLAFGTDYEYYNAVWVKNEWSRFLKLIAKDKSKHLIPCYKNIDAYDMPSEFKNLQAQDMGKVGAIQDLLRGIEKLHPINKAPVPAVQHQASGIATEESLLKRAYIHLDDGEFSYALEYFDKVLDINPERVDAYTGKLLSEFKCRKRDELGTLSRHFNTSATYNKLIRFADDNLKAELDTYSKKIVTNIELRNFEKHYQDAIKAVNRAKKDADILKAAELFDKTIHYKDSAQRKQACIHRVNENYYRTVSIQMSRCGTSNDFLKVADNFNKIINYKDSAFKRVACLKRAAELKEVEAEKRKRKKRIGAFFGISIPTAIIAIIVAAVVLVTVVIPSSCYKKGEEYLANNNYMNAAKEFGNAIYYKDSKSKLSKITEEVININYINNRTVGTAVAAGTNIYGECDLEDWTDIVAIAAGACHTVGVKADGTVVANGYDSYGACDIESWTDIVTVAAGENYTVGIKSDGTVVATGDNYKGQCNVDGWTDIVSVATGNNHTVGVKSDGTVVATGDIDDDKCKVSNWTDIVAVAAGDYCTVGLKADGTVVVTESSDYSIYDHDHSDVESWTDIVAIAVSPNSDMAHIVGLKSDGTVVAVGNNGDGQCDVDGWSDIVAVATGEYCTVGLKSDGTVVAVGDNYSGQCDVVGWTDVAAISAGRDFTVALEM